MLKSYKIGEKKLTVSVVEEIIKSKSILIISDRVKKKIVASRNFLDNKVSALNDPIYGVNTGFGSLCNNKIQNKDLEKLQKNLVFSHACGTGKEVPVEIVKIMLLLKVQTLSKGYSGVQLKTVQRLVDMFNNQIFPVVYQQGSLGASGDLAPLAHLSLPLIGEGEVDVPGISDNGYYKRHKSFNVFKNMNWKVIRLRSKEGLALLNGTQFMSAYMVWSLIKSKKLSYLADIIGSLSIEAFDASIEPFNKLIHNLRPYTGQITTAKNISKFLKGSHIQRKKKEYVQDPYSFRCIPQVHGSVKSAIDHVQDICNTEIDSVTDNPIVFVNEEKVLSGGNFHGQPLAMGMDYLAIALAELGSISERRIYQLLSGKRGLPPFLISNPGVNSGMMIPQYTAASIVSENKQLCTPASIDSIVSSNGQEDHVSMGANSARKLFKVVENIERILAIEIMNATQALGFRNIRSSNFLEKILDDYRSEVKFLDNDRLLYKDIRASISFLREIKI